MNGGGGGLLHHQCGKMTVSAGYLSMELVEILSVVQPHNPFR